MCARSLPPVSASFFGNSAQSVKSFSPQKFKINSVVDPHGFNADPDPGSRTNADPDSGRTLQSENVKFLHEKYTCCIVCNMSQT